MKPEFDFSTDEGRDDAACFLSAYAASCTVMKKASFALQPIKDALNEAYTQGVKDGHKEARHGL